MKKFLLIRNKLFILLVLLLVAFTNEVKAVGKTASVSGNWNNTATWGGSAAPTSSDDLTINAGITVTMNVAGSCKTIKDMKGGAISGANALTIAGNSGVAITNISGTATISCPVVMPASASITVAGSLTISGVISGAVTNLTKAGAGTLTLSAYNTYTGATTISAGILSVENPDNLGQSYNDPWNLVFGGGTLQYTGPSGNNNRNFTLIAGTTSTYDITNGTTEVAVYGVSTNTTGALIKAGPGTLKFMNQNLYTGLTTVTEGTLKYGNNNVLSTGGVTLNGGTFDIDIYSDAVGAVTLISGTIAGTTGVLTGTSYDLQSGMVSAILAGAVALNKTSTGTVVLSGANTYSGATSVSAGILSVQNNTALGTTAGSTTVSSGATLQLQGNITVGAEALTLSGTGTSLNGALNNQSGSNTWSGTITLSGASTAEVRFQNNGGTLNLNATDAIIMGDHSLNMEGDGNTIISGIISGTGIFRKCGDYSSVTLSGNNTYTGQTRIETGNLIVNSLGNLGVSCSLGAPTTTVNGTIILGNTMGWNKPCKLIYTGPSTSTNRVIDLQSTGGGTIDASGTGPLVFTSAFTSTLSGSKTLTLKGSNMDNNSISGVIPNGSGTISLIKSGTGTWLLLATNTFTGGTTLNSGTLNINNAQALGTAAGTFTINGGIIDNTSGSSINTVNYPLALNGNFTFTGTKNLNLGTGTVSMNTDLIITVSANTLKIGGAISASSYSLTKAGNGTLNFGSAPISLKDLTIIDSGTLLSTSNTLTLFGNYSNSGTFSHNSGTVIFNGTTAQTIDGSSVTNFNNLTINNSNGGISLNSSPNINSSLTMTSGILTTSSYYIDLGSTGSLSENNPNSQAPTSYITGNVKATRNINSGVTQSFGGIGLDITTSAKSSISTQVIRVTGTYSYNNIGNKSIKRYFDISPVSKIGITSMVFHYFNNEIVDFNEANLILFNSVVPPYTKWSSQLGSLDMGSNIYTKNDISELPIITSRWSLGPFDAPLPIELLSFNAIIDDGNVIITWATASETGSYFFTVEKSKYGQDFMEVAKIEGAGYSNSAINYSTVDKEPYQGLSYYRIKETDFDGKIFYSQMVPVNFNNESKVLFFPNPTNGALHIALPYSAGSVVIDVYNVIGSKVYSETFCEENLNNNLVYLDVKKILGQGIFLIKVKTNNDVVNCYSRKIIIY